MTNDLDLCPGCFSEPLGEGACRRCGYLHDPTQFPSALKPGTVLSKYKLGRVLGKPGGFGITYLAFDPVLNRRSAIKELMPRELVARRPDGATVEVHSRDDGETFKHTLASFLKEARLLAQFSHPNVVRILDYFEANGTAYFAMEYYEGQTLAEYIRRSGGKLPGPEAVSLMLPLLDALDHIHTLPEPILHRDIKPANIYLTGRRVPILLDFGAARVAMGQQSQSLSAVLTPSFAPYQQYSSRGKQGPWSDVYACAATLYYAVTGTLPPEASERIDDPRIQPPRALVPDLSPQLSDAIVSGLGFKPDERPQSARAFADILSGRAPAAIAAEQDTVPHVAVGASGVATSIAGLPDRTIVEPVVPRRSLPATEIAPPLPAPVVAPPPVVVVGRSQSPSASPSQTRRAPNRTPLFAGLAALVMVAVATVSYLALTPGPGAPKAQTESVKDQGQGQVQPPPAQAPPPQPFQGDSEQRVRATEPAPPPVPDKPIVKSSGERIDTAGAGAAAVKVEAPKPVKPEPVSDAKRGAPATSINATLATPPSVPARVAEPPRPAPTAVLVVIRGDDRDSAEQAESAILGSIAGRNGLHALDATSLSMMRGDQSAVLAASQGNFAELANMGRPHGVELMVVGELRSRAMPSINRFFTGTAELSVKMYRVSNSQIVDTHTFIVGQGGAQAVLAISAGEARSRAASEAARSAADEVAIWLNRAF